MNQYAIANLRHLYNNMVNGGVKDVLSAKHIAEGLLSQTIQMLENSVQDSIKGHEIIEAALKKASENNPNNAPFPMTHSHAICHQIGMASAYLHALEMIPSQKDIK